MGPTYFADTWFFIAFTDPRDSHYRQARRLWNTLGSSRLVTHDAVLTELLAYFSASHAQARLGAVRIVRQAFVDMKVHHVDSSIFRTAVSLYEERPDKHYSLVDCMSMVVMRDQGITHVLTNDHHFRQEGFTVFSDAP